MRAGSEAAARELDWSILMARAQGGDGEAYRRLLTDMLPICTRSRDGITAIRTMSRTRCRTCC